MARRGEFDLIASVFAPLADVDPAARGLADDGAVLDPPPGGEKLVLSVDTLVSGVHFRPDDPPGDIARKAVRVNLSDLAAMGARPRGLLLAAAFSGQEDDAWIEAFAAGLRDDLARYGVGLLGGDTVATPGPASFTVTALGHVPADGVLGRAGGQPGETLWVSGTIGDSALGLDWLSGDMTALAAEDGAWLAARYRVPDPPVALGEALRGLATAGLDVSDGLVADLGHLCRAGGCGAHLQAQAVPVSEAARRCLEADPARLVRVLTGGDDYQLLFSAPESRATAVRAAAERAGVSVTPIGRLEAGAGVRVTDSAGRALDLTDGGWRHAW
jgi:thiamine-monophosphate kinase